MVQPTNKELFFAFQKISLSAFGGALPWAKIILVEQKQWMSLEEFAEILSLCQFIPGPNIVNVSIVVGKKANGAVGAFWASLGLLFFPFCLACIVGATYAELSHYQSLNGVFEGIGAVAAGLMLSMSYEMAQKVFIGKPMLLIFSIAAFVALVLLHVHIFFALVVLAPLAIGYALWSSR